MKRRAIVYSDGAKLDILGIDAYLARDSAINADKAIERLAHRIEALATLSERGRVVPELQWHGITGIREVFEKPWRICYHIRANEVLIVAIYDGRRHLNDVLMERFLR